MELVECIEKFLLHSFLVCEKLNIVYKKNVGSSVFFVKIGNNLCIQSVYKVVSEGFACYIDYIA